MGEDLPRHIQEIRKNVLIPTMKKIKQESHKATVVRDKLVVNGKVYFHYDVPTRWLPVNSSVNTQVDYMAMAGYSRTTRTIAKSRRIL